MVLIYVLQNHIKATSFLTITGYKTVPFPPWTILGSRLYYFNQSLKSAHKFQHTIQTRNDTQKIQHFGSTTSGTKLSLFQPWTILGSRLHYFNSSLKTTHIFQHTTQTRNDTQKKSTISDPQHRKDGKQILVISSRPYLKLQRYIAPINSL